MPVFVEAALTGALGFENIQGLYHDIAKFSAKEKNQEK